MYADSLVAGYWGGGLWQGRDFAAVKHWRRRTHLLNMCVALTIRAKVMGHVAEGLVSKLVMRVPRRCFTVRAGNGRALNLYQSVGFGQIGVRKDYYPGALGREDAVCMALNRNSRSILVPQTKASYMLLCANKA